MTEVAGSVKQIGQGLTQKTYSYEPLNALVDIVTNAAGTFIQLFPSDYQLTILFRPSCSSSCSEADRWRRKFFALAHTLRDTDASQPARQLGHKCCIEYLAY